MRLYSEEPAAGPWRVETVPGLVSRLIVNWPDDRPAILAIDGRSSSGKSTLAARIADLVDGAAVVHSDDVAWHHSAFGWADLLTEEVLVPLRRGRAVSFRPPGWQQRGRPGAIEVPAGLRLVVTEGVGVGRAMLMPFLDSVLWVQADREQTAGRDLARVAAGEISEENYRRWMAEESVFIVEERPWERVAAIVAGTPVLDHDPANEIVVADPPT